MPLVYSFVARITAAHGAPNVLVEAMHPSHQGNFKLVAQKLLQRLHTQHVSSQSLLAATSSESLDQKQHANAEQLPSRVSSSSEQTHAHQLSQAFNASASSLNDPDSSSSDSSNSKSTALSSSSSASASSTLNNNAPSSNERQTLLFEGHLFSFFRRGTLWFLCVADRMTGQVKPYAYLNDAIDTYMRATNDGVSVPEGASLRALSEALTGKLELYSKDRTELEQEQKHHQAQQQRREEEDEPVDHVKRELDGVKNVLLDNLDRVIARGEALESLVDRSDQLHSSAENFKSQSTRLKNNMCWSSTRSSVTLALATLLIMYFIVAFRCGLTLRVCFPSS